MKPETEWEIVRPMGITRILRAISGAKGRLPLVASGNNGHCSQPACQVELGVDLGTAQAGRAVWWTSRIGY